MASSLPLSFHIIHNNNNNTPKPLSLSQYISNTSFLSAHSSSTSLVSHHICYSNLPEREESRWLREEQRWLREEQRWLREERRWEEEREALLLQIKELKLRLKEIENNNNLLPEASSSVSDTVANIAKLLQLLKEGELGKNVHVIAESGSIALPLVLEAAKQNEVIVKEEPQEEKVIREVPKESKGEGKEVKKRKTLKKGSEGDEVRLLQEQLLKLGFYCGEEDEEFSIFSSGTERAVKTWQSSCGIREDGIMTSELLEKLYMVQKIDGVKENPKQPDVAEAKARANGAPVATIMEIEEVQQTTVKEDGVSETEVSHHRVFLLGENRWEEPSRLTASKKQAKTTSGSTTTKCLTCRGEGRLLCMECDGTGEPNIEEQFMEWIDEGMKCPYCEGHGFITCDVCEGKKIMQA
ncbi:protein disulfide isomerase pTAC5, chloroplastic [Lycium ferocissimum]|uniref:protein disulfide isomerase pTAC5, chloroplastic n=1 Tax=Lycium ferocissimum TaxID=112874 RepID=UPI002815454C|nr:protein disulfide isomerase pTAC5, chloroplastic [Lycium ferocissimum]